MVRRLLLILGMVLTASSMASVARGQDDNRMPPPEDPSPAVSPLPPASLPVDLPLPVAAPGAESLDPGAAQSTPPLQKNQQKKEADAPAAKKGASGKGQSAPKLKSRPGDAATSQDPAPPRYDEHLDLTQAAVPSDSEPPAAPRPVAAAGGAAEGTEKSRASVDRLPIGKQSVAVSVDVQAPASMNLQQEATLKLIVRNSGTSDALNIDVHDELPDGLQYVASQPEMHVTGDSHLSLRINTLPAGSDRVITIRVKPTQPGSYDHAATVRFETGCKSRTRVLEPKLKVDVVANPTVGKVLKGQSVEFKVSVTNNGTGPARNVAIQAKLTPGLRHESGGRGDEQMLYELTLPDLMPGQTERLDPLVADAIGGGEQGCTVTAKSDDVVFSKNDAEVTKSVTVVEPKVKLTLKGPDSRYTDTVADYEITLDNPGSAPARKLRVLVTLPVSGRLVKTPPDARYDSATRRLSWSVDQLEPGGKSMTFPFQVRMGGIGRYEVLAEAAGDGGLKGWDRLYTAVVGMPDVDLVVSESKRVLDVGGTTTFQIRLRNYGTVDATNLQVTANLSKNLHVEATGGGPKDLKAMQSPDKSTVKFEEIPRLGPSKEIILGIQVKVVGEDPKLATCRVSVTHEDLPEPFEDMAGVKVTTARRAAAAPGAAEAR
jgi:uncharacterized repeat protein (TIGR01451 family)